jgi:hypothetical protein
VNRKPGAKEGDKGDHLLSLAQAPHRRDYQRSARRPGNLVGKGPFRWSTGFGVGGDHGRVIDLGCVRERPTGGSGPVSYGGQLQRRR